MLLNTRCCTPSDAARAGAGAGAGAVVGIYYFIVFTDALLIFILIVAVFCWLALVREWLRNSSI